MEQRPRRDRPAAASSSSTTPPYNQSSTFSYPSTARQPAAPIKVAEDWTMTLGPPGTPALVTPDPVTGLAATAGRRRVDLSWTNPTTAFEAVRIVRKAGARRPRPERRHAVYLGTAVVRRHRLAERHALLATPSGSSAARSARSCAPRRHADRRQPRPGDGPPGDAGRPEGRPLLDEPDEPVRPRRTSSARPARRLRTRPTAPRSTRARRAAFADTGLTQRHRSTTTRVWVQRGADLSPGDECLGDAGGDAGRRRHEPPGRRPATAR